MERVAKRFISPALIAGIFCPPIGLGALLSLWVAISQLHKGNTSLGIKSLDLAKNWIRTTIYVTLVVLLIASITLYLMGPRLIAPMGSFY